MLSRALPTALPDISDATCLLQGFIEGALSAGEKHAKITRYFADYHFFNLFSFPLIAGNKDPENGQRQLITKSSP